MDSLPIDVSHPAVREYLALVRLQVLTPLTLLINIATTTVCASLANPTMAGVSRLHQTVFSPNIGVIGSYIALVFLGQLAYCVLLVIARKEETKAALIKGVGPSLVIANITMAVWSIAWVLQWFMLSTLLQGFLLLVLIYANINLLVYHAPDNSRPIDTGLIHAPLRFFLVLPLNILFPLCLFITLGFFVRGYETGLPVDESKWHPNTGLLVVLGINLVELVVIVARHDIVWCVAATWTNVSLWAGRPKPAEIYITAITLTVLHPLGLIISMAYQWFVKRREGQIALPDEDHQAARGPREIGDDTWRTYMSGSLVRYQLRKLSTVDDTTSLEVKHSRFLAEAPPKSRWGKQGITDNGNGVEDEMEGITSIRGKLLPTSSHLFKLVLPLSHIKNRTVDIDNNTTSADKDVGHPSVPPTIFLLHPSQPLSHISRLIASSIILPSTSTRSKAQINPQISFRSTTTNGNVCQWSDSTDVGDFIKDAARAAEFRICISYDDNTGPHSGETKSNNTKASQSDENENEAQGEHVITVAVPTFADRTKYLRRRLTYVKQRLEDMEGLKRDCDREAHRGARKMALGGFGMLVVYWGTVARLTFWDYGWDVMEPITYLSGLSTVILGYLWFLYQGREVSYTSVLARSISARRDALYKARKFDIERWMELLSEKKALKSQIEKIARDYEEDEFGNDEEGPGTKAEAEDDDDNSTALKNPKDKGALVIDMRTGETKI
ncbi:hypothetical protein CVT24_003101 [Panaeolus cyanescens]|uniref:Calcium uniporter protein, mitochondrial n=1 Tax=Panaeolus cyanescens TaxID=181874 RepID=A0A409YXR5_9AGAR|nr:hypothetical protein CVT24_003101 [Panaeolus cyanescens]